MTLEQRLVKLQAARRARPSPNAASSFAALVAVLDRLAARKASGDEAAQVEINVLAGAARQ